MKKHNLKVLFSLLSLATYGITSCAAPGEDLSKAPEFKTVLLSDLTKGKPAGFMVSDGWTNGSPFGVYWNAKNAVYSDEGMTLKITKDGDKYYGGEMKTTGEEGLFQYGYFSTTMKVCPVAGTASTFFTYTGPSDNQVHDEIDIEFLGKDMKTVQFNYFTNGQGGHEYKYELGFDPSEEYHDYGFYWDEGQIIWYVDNKPVYRRTDNIPTHPQRIFTNFWKGDNSMGVLNWLGALDESKLDKCSVQYTKINYADLNGEGRVFSTGPTNKDATPINLNFASTQEYTTENNEDKTQCDVTYSEIQGQTYKNINSALPSRAKTATLFSIKIKNLGSALVAVRINVNADTTHGKNNIKAINTKAGVEGKGEVPTDLEWGGSMFEVEPNEEIIANVVYEGEATQVELMIDSHRSGGPFSGHLLLSEYKLLGGKENDNPDTPADVDDDYVPTISESALALDYTSSETYTITESEDKKYVDVTYADMGQTYHNVSASLPEDAKSKNVLTFTIKNLGANKTTIRADVNAATTHGENNIRCINVSAKNITDDQDLTTDLSWGGSYLEIDSNAEKSVAITYDGEASEIMFMIDSTTSSSSTGHVVISNILLSSEQEAVNPDDQVTGQERGVTPAFENNNGDTSYTITSLGEGQKVSYENLAGNSYKTVVMNFQSIYQEGDFAISVTMKNNSTNSIKGRFDCKDYSTGDERRESAVEAIGDGTSAQMGWQNQGAEFAIQPDKTGTIKVTFEGKITQLELFLDSCTWDDENTHTGEVEILSMGVFSA